MKFAFLFAACLPILVKRPVANYTRVRHPPCRTSLRRLAIALTLEISAASQQGKAPVALKWEVVFPAQLMELEGGGPEIGSTAMKAGKSLQCTARTPYAYVCTLSGGQKPVADGTIAIYHFRIRAKAKAGITSLRIERAESTTMDSRKWTLNNTEAIVIIR